MIFLIKAWLQIDSAKMMSYNYFGLNRKITFIPKVHQSIWWIYHTINASNHCVYPQMLVYCFMTFNFRHHSAFIISLRVHAKKCHVTNYLFFLVIISKAISTRTYCTEYSGNHPSGGIWWVVCYFFRCKEV